MRRIIVKNLCELIGVLVAPLALVPTKSPLWRQNWKTNNFLINLGDHVRSVTKNDVKISKSASSNSANGDVTSFSVILNPPILSSSQVDELSKPSFVGCFGHYERMCSVHVGTWSSGCLLWVGNVSAPKSVDSIFQE